MGAICCCGKSADADDEEANQKFQKGSEKSLTKGLKLDNRGCTDIICLIAFIAHWVVFLVVTLAEAGSGEPTKLYLPRDFQGNYCDLKKNFNNGPDLDNHPSLIYMMNVTAATDTIMNQMMCSSAYETALRRLVGTPGWSAQDMSAYECSCCKTPCAGCPGSLSLTDLSTSDISSVIAAKMNELTATASSGNLFSPSSANGDFFSNIWSQATKYFVKVCTKSCGDTNVAPTRNWSYVPAADSPLYKPWTTLITSTSADATVSAIRTTMQTSFNFSALPSHICPYHDRYCVPFPGVEFQKTAAGYCLFKMNAQVISAIGSTASSAFESLGGNAIAKASVENFGQWVGDFRQSIDAFVMVSVGAFVIGLVYLVLLRLFVSCVVWFAIFLVFVIFLMGGGTAMVRSTQCAGASLFASGKNVGVSGLSFAESQMRGTGGSEAMSGNGADYLGFQYRSRSGKVCQAWNSQSPHNHTYTPVDYPYANLTSNYCRNPSGASSIWCFTQDPAKRWELCSAIGVFQPECVKGYEVENETERSALKVFAYILWVLAALWLLFIMCMCSRIRQAVAVMTVAVNFVKSAPFVILVPVIQTVIGIVWALLWVLSASFLLSQVPASHTPTGAFATYTEAIGPKMGCRPTQPYNNEVWKDENCAYPAVGVPKCWRCSPPRFNLDYRSLYSLFTYLWNNELNVAIGQCVIAGAVGMWFFAPRPDKKNVNSIRGGLWLVFRYHLGSVAFGSLIIAIVQTCRYVMRYLEQQAKAQHNQFMKWVFRIIQCCLWCFEKCLKFLNKNAYIQVALRGTSFCLSAKNAFMLIFRNLARFSIVAVLGTIIHTLGWVFITALTVIYGYFILRAVHPSLNPVFPLIIYGIVGYVVGKLYMNVFGLAVDTCLQCFIITEEEGGDSAESPFVPDGMTHLLPQRSTKTGVDDE